MWAVWQVERPLWHIVAVISLEPVFLTGKRF